jgi:hypothetical protein
VWPRLTLVVSGAIGETVPVVLGVPFRLAGPPGSAPPPGAAVVEVTVDRLVITAGTLRSPGRFGSLLSLRWRDLTPAPDEGPLSPVGDPGIPLPPPPPEPAQPPTDPPPTSTLAPAPPAREDIR